MGMVALFVYVLMSSSSASWAARGASTVVVLESEFSAALGGVEDEPPAEHVLVQAHLDLSMVPVRGGALYFVRGTTQSIQGDCPPDMDLPAVSKTPEMLPMRPLQCMIVYAQRVGPLFVVSSAPAQPADEFAMWLSNLYLRANRTALEFTSESAALFVLGGSVYLEGVTIQNDGKELSLAVAQWGDAKTHFQECTVVDFWRTGFPAVMTFGAASFDNCTFQSLATSSNFAAVFLLGAAASVRATSCVFDDVFPVGVNANDSAAVAYVDEDSAVFVEPGMVQLMANATPGGLFISTDDDALDAVKMAAPEPSQDPDQWRPVSSDSGEGATSEWLSADNPSRPWIPLLIIPFAILAVIALVVLLARYKGQAQQPADFDELCDMQTLEERPGGGRVASATAARHPCRRAESDESTGPALLSGGRESGSASDSPRLPDCSTPVRALEAALDEMQQSDTLLLGKFFVQGVLARRPGPRGPVQFVVQVNPVRECAVRFFLERGAFEFERQLYEREELKGLVPPAGEVVDNDNGELQTPSGYVFPPCVVLEKGLPLSDFACSLERQQNGILTRASQRRVLLSLVCVAERLRRLHAAGFVHRGVQPENILWLASENAWVLADFGSTVPIGEHAPVAAARQYAAPEVLHAVQTTATSMTVRPSLDMYQLGAVAFELLTGSQASSCSTTTLPALSAGVMGELGKAEEDGADLQEVQGRVRHLVRTILECLSVEPDERPSAATVVAGSCDARPAWSDGRPDLSATCSSKSVQARGHMLAQFCAALQSRDHACGSN